jgi:HlyD family secretion protein
MTQNVVTYTVEVTTDNSSGKLLPYLTANVRFEVDRRDNVLQVPNSALRWQPQTEQIAPEAKPTQQANAQDTANNPRHATTRQAADTSASHGVVWVRAGDYVRPIPLRLGITDGSVTELQSTELNEGIEVVIGQTSNGTQTTTTATRNPFLPQMPARSSGRNTASSPGPHPPP